MGEGCRGRQSGRAHQFNVAPSVTDIFRSQLWSHSLPETVLIHHAGIALVIVFADIGEGLHLDADAVGVAE